MTAPTLFGSADSRASSASAPPHHADHDHPQDDDNDNANAGDENRSVVYDQQVKELRESQMLASLLVSLRYAEKHIELLQKHVKELENKVLEPLKARVKALEPLEDRVVHLEHMLEVVLGDGSKLDPSRFRGCYSSTEDLVSASSSRKKKTVHWDTVSGLPSAATVVEAQEETVRLFVPNRAHTSIYLT